MNENNLEQMDHQNEYPKDNGIESTDGHRNRPPKDNQSDLRMEYINQRKILNWIGLSLFIMAAAILLMQIIIEFFVHYYIPKFAETDWYVWAVTALTVVGVGLPVFYSFIKRIPDSPRGERVHLSILQFIALFFVCVAVMYATNYFGVFINFIISIAKGEEIFNPALDAILGSNMIIMIIYGVIIAPIVEEVIFRKLLLSKLRRFGDLPAILLSGFAFGLFHMNLSQFFYATALGILFAYIVIKTNTIRYTVLLHMMINFIGTAVAPLATEPVNIVLVMIMGIWVIVSMTIGGLIIAFQVKKVRLEKSAVPVEKKSVYVLNAGTILFILLCLIMMVQVVLYK
jgi:uncharacterized protein